MSGYSIAGALGGYGYDEYSAPSAWDEENNYNKAQRTERPRSFRARVDAKKQELRMAQQAAMAEHQAEKPKTPKTRTSKNGNESDECQCIECAPHLYRSTDHHEKKEKHDCDCHDCKNGRCRGLFNNMTQQDYFIIFIVIIISIVLYSMYCTICRLSEIAYRLGGPVHSNVPPNVVV